MVELWPQVLIAFWVSLIASAFGSPLIMRLLAAAKSRQTVSQYAPEGHQVKQGTPTMGGLIILVGFFVWSGWSIIAPGRTEGQSAYASILSLTVGFALIGFVDDFVVPRWLTGKRGLGWKQKIIAQLAVAGAVSLQYYGPHIGVIHGVAIFIILFFANAYNFSDGLDGLAGTIFLSFAVGLAGVCIAASWATLFLIPLAAMVGGVISFLYWNAPPAKVFMGDVGSLPIGAFLGFVISVLLCGPAEMAHSGSTLAYGPMNPSVMILAVLVLSGMMLIELVPVPLQILSVKVRKKKLFLYTPIHHAFEKIGWKETRIVAAFALLQLILSVGAISIAIFQTERELKLPVTTFDQSPGGR